MPFIREDDGDLLPILNEARSFILGRRLEFPETTEPEYRREISRLHGSLALSIRSLIEVRTVAQDVGHVIQMVQRFPWRGTKITRSKHHHLTWFLFVNLCYLFEEKVKRFYDSASASKKILNVPQQPWLKEELRQIKKGLGKHIRHRGEFVHEYGLSHSAINFFEMIEILAQAGDERALETKNEHFSDMRFSLKMEIRRAYKFMDDLYGRLLAIEEAHLINSMLVLRQECEEQSITAHHR